MALDDNKILDVTKLQPPPAQPQESDVFSEVRLNAKIHHLSSALYNFFIFVVMQNFMIRLSSKRNGIAQNV